MNAINIFRFLLASSLFLSYATMAQSISRQTLCTTGSSNLINGVLVSQTVGQPYHTGAYYGSEIYYLPGFQQPTTGYDFKSTDRLTLSLFPNPVFDLLTIQSSGVISNAIIRVTDMSGINIHTEAVSNLKTYSVDCTHWANGSYIFSISNGKSVISSYNVIVNHY